jgi:periplasmic divalent cation tolerance protein
VGIVSVYCVFADKAEAQRIGRMVVEEGLAACINILEACRSLYRWQGKVEEVEEVPAILKTSPLSAERLIARMAELHSYEVPAITAWPVSHALPVQLTWVEQGFES